MPSWSCSTTLSRMPLASVAVIVAMLLATSLVGGVKAIGVTAALRKHVAEVPGGMVPLQTVDLRLTFLYGKC